MTIKTMTPAEAVQEVLDAAGDAPIVVHTPQFTRPEGNPKPLAPPSDAASWASLSTCSTDELRRIGLRCWGETPDGSKELWLLPGEWYESIPDGTELVDIFFEREVFQRGTTDNDIRFGCLAYGILREVSET